MSGPCELLHLTNLSQEGDEESAGDEIQASIEARVRSGAAQRLSSDGDDDDGPEGEDADDDLAKVKSEDSGFDEERAERELAPGIATVIDLTEDGPHSDVPGWGPMKAIPVPPQRNAPLDKREILTCLRYGKDDLVLRPGAVVELPEIAHIYRASFLRIQYIIQSHSGDIFLRGLPFTRTRHLRGQLPRLRNEVCLVLQVDADDGRPAKEQAAIEIPVTEVKRARNLHCTNATFPENRYPHVYGSVAEIEDKGMLACRWKCVLTYKDADARINKQPPCQFMLAHLRADEASTEHCRVSDRSRLNNWRGSKVRGGSYDKLTGKDLEPVEDVDEDPHAEPAWILKKPGQRYSMGDMFSGAGGASLGAQQAGFHIRVACDKSPHACKTHRINFPQTDLREEDIYKFMREDLVWGGGAGYVDVLHLSPPCQFWSPAHTVPSANDEANIAVLFSCRELVRKLRPRLFTLEQTFGIMHPRFEHYFNALVHGFTQNGYSVRWRVVNLLDWGLPSRRNRLVVIGACAGERLPPFPRATHARDPAPGSGARPHATVIEALRRIPPAGATLHADRKRYHYQGRGGGPGQRRRGRRRRRRRRRQRPPWDPRAPLARCITTHGGYGNYHYAGRRDFTPRELATMNGFPARYEFHPAQAKRQIGNAFPPCAVRLLYGHLRRWLEDEDRVRPIEEQAVVEEEPEYDIEATDFEEDEDEDEDSNDEVEFIREEVRGKVDGGGSDDGISMDIDAGLLCIDPDQELQEAGKGSVIDLTDDSSGIGRKDSPIVIMDID